MAVPLRRGIRSLIRSAASSDNPPSGERALLARADGWYDRTSDGTEYRLESSLALTVTTNAQGVATVNFAAGRFTTAPVVSTDVEATSTSGTQQPTQVEILSISKDAVTVRTWRQQVTLLNTLGLNVTPSVLVSAKVHLIARPASA